MIRGWERSREMLHLVMGVVVTILEHASRRARTKWRDRNGGRSRRAQMAVGGEAAQKTSFGAQRREISSVQFFCESTYVKA
jgi:hypothetical protein